MSHYGDDTNVEATLDTTEEIDDTLDETKNTSPIHGPLPMIILLDLILVRGQTVKLFQ